MAAGLDRLGPIGLMLVITLGLCGCKEDRMAERKVSEPPPVRVGAPGENTVGGRSSPSTIPAAPALSESDSIILEMAQSACREGNPSAFFGAFARSGSVRERYTGASVTVGRTGKTRKISRQKYVERDLFPITMMDYFYVTSDAGRGLETEGGEPDAQRYVQLEISEASDRRLVVEWLPGIFEKDLTPPPPNLEDGLGELVQETGSGGRLLFLPTDDCWELVADVKNPPLEL